MEDSGVQKATSNREAAVVSGVGESDVHRVASLQKDVQPPVMGTYPPPPSYPAAVEPLMSNVMVLPSIPYLGPSFGTLFQQQQHIAQMMPGFTSAAPLPTTSVPPPSLETSTPQQAPHIVFSDDYQQHSSQKRKLETNSAKPPLADRVVKKSTSRSSKKSCDFAGCTKQCSFNYEWESKPRFCSTHKLVDMIDVKHKTCEVDGCGKQPYFNYAEIKKGRFCATHKLKDMINVKHKSCEFEGCDKQPSFNFPGLHNGLYCSFHKLPTMINVKNKTCIAPGCIKVPSYNYIDEPKAIFCTQHKKENMIDVISKRCEASGCMKRPSFNYPGKSGCRFCSSHKLEGMIDIISRICEVGGCRKNASCNYEGLSRRRFCSAHKLPDMINIITAREEQLSGQVGQNNSNSVL